MKAPDSITVHQLLTRDEILERTPLDLRIGLRQRDWLEVLVRLVETDTLARAARMTRELEVLLPYSGTVREAVAVALEARSDAARRVASRISTEHVIRSTAYLRRAS